MAKTVKLKKRLSRAETAEYWLYLSLAYPLFFAAAAVRRLARRFAPKEVRRARAGRGSLFIEAADAAQSAIPWVFMARG